MLSFCLLVKFGAANLQYLHIIRLHVNLWVFTIVIKVDSLSIVQCACSHILYHLAYNTCSTANFSCLGPTALIHMYMYVYQKNGAIKRNHVHGVENFEFFEPVINEKH